MKKKKDPLMLVIYAVIALFGLYFAAALGTAMDTSLDEKGGLDFTAFGNNIESTMTDADLVFSHLVDTSSYGFKIPLIGTVAAAIYIMLKVTTKKRLHRKGVEHGSARWATEKEAKSLADKPPKPKKGEKAAPKPPKSPFETDNNIILTQEVRMSLNTRQHRENLNVLVIGGSGSGKSRFYVKPNLMQLNTSFYTGY